MQRKANLGMNAILYTGAAQLRADLQAIEVL
jgi:hypothetical protein